MTSPARLLLPVLLSFALGCGTAGDPPLQFSSAELPGATVGRPYQAVIAVTNAIGCGMTMR